MTVRGGRSGRIGSGGRARSRRSIRRRSALSRRGTRRSPTRPAPTCTGVEEGTPEAALRCSDHPADPSEFVGDFAALDADELGPQGFGDRAASAIADDEAAPGRLDLADRGDDGGRAAGKGLAQPPACGVAPPRVVAVALYAHGLAIAPGERDDRIPGDARQNGAAERRRQHRAVVEDEEDVHAAELFDPAAFGGVEKDDLVAAVP